MRRVFCHSRDPSGRTKISGFAAAEIAGLLDVKPGTIRAYLRAGACPDCGGPVVGHGSRRCQGCGPRPALRPAFAPEEILAALREWTAAHGTRPSAIDRTPSEDRSRQWAREYPRRPSHAQAGVASGGWNAALKAAGLVERKPSWDRESVSPPSVPSPSATAVRRPWPSCGRAMASAMGIGARLTIARTELDW
jgi:hypothetical protein